MHRTLPTLKRPAATLPVAMLLVLLTPPLARAQVTQQAAQQAVAETQLDVFTRADADLVLSLEQAVDLALDQSFSVFQFRQQFLQSAYSLESAKRSLRTRINYSGTLPNIRQSINSQLVTGTSGDPELLYLRGGSTQVRSTISVVQPLITNGTLTLAGGLSGFDSFNELPGDRETLNRSVQPSVSINFTQPLFQYNDIKGSLKNAELNYESLDRRYTEDELRQINQITQQFYSLFQQQQALDLQVKTFQQSDANYQTGVRKYQAGLIAEVDRLQLEVQRANDQDRLETAKNNLRQAQFAFNRRVGLPLEQKVWAEASLAYRPIEVDVDRALELAFQNRADIRLAEISLESAELSLQSTIAQGRPNLQLNVGYDLTGNSSLAGLGATDSWSDHLREALNPDYRNPNTNISLTLQIPVFDWGLNASRVQRQRASMEVTSRNIDEARLNLRQDVINRVEAVQSAMRRMEIQQKNIDVARTSYNITSQRYDRGEITITDLLRAQQTQFDTETAYNNALIALENAKANLKEITLWDWENNQPVRQRTTRPVAFGGGE